MSLLRKFNESEKKDRLATLPNLLTLSRAVGGVALGTLMAAKMVGPMEAFSFAAILGATDAEGNIIKFSEKYPRLQKALRIFPSKIGSDIDSIADKALTIPVIIGGILSGEISSVIATGLIASEAITSGVTIAAKLKDKEPEVSNVGKLGMISRVGTIGSNLLLSSVPYEGHPVLHNALETTTNVGFAASMGLGLYSAYTLYKENFSK